VPHAINLQGVYSIIAHSPIEMLRRQKH
jgi:hypothetical protein